MTYSLISFKTCKTTKLCLVDCGNGSTLELNLPLEYSETQILDAALLYSQKLLASKQEIALREAEIELNTRDYRLALLQQEHQAAIEKIDSEVDNE